MKVSRQDRSSLKPWVLDFYDAEGVRRTPSFRTREEAKRAEAEISKRLEKGTYVAPAQLPTFGGLAEDLFASKAAHRPSTRAQLRVHLDLHLLPATFGTTLPGRWHTLGELRIDRITVEVAEAVRAYLVGKKLGPATVNKVLTTAAAIFKLALRRGLVERNPFALVERLRVGAGELGDDDRLASGGSDGTLTDADVLAPTEVQSLLAATDAGRARTLVLTGYLTGGRPNELLALRWPDFELTPGDGWVTFRRAYSWARVRGETDDVRARIFRPKTKSGTRRVRIPDELVEALTLWKLACPPTPQDLVFPNDHGGPLHLTTFLKRAFYPALRRAKLRQLGLKALRHGHASAMLAAGGSITEVQQRLGHANPSITLAVYSHWISGTPTTALAVLARLVTTPPSATGTSPSTRAAGLSKVDSPVQNGSKMVATPAAAEA